MSDSIHVLGISGSLRRASFNSAALRAASEMLPEGMTLEIYDLNPLPMYNWDVEQAGLPEAVQHFRERMYAADALLIATPEYNYSITSALKNAIDWASRPPESPLNNKIAGIMGAATGAFGTVRSQLHLRDILMHNNIHVVNTPQVLIMNARQKFDADLRLVDEDTRGFMRQMLVNLLDLTRRLKA